MDLLEPYLIKCMNISHAANSNGFLKLHMKCNRGKGLLVPVGITSSNTTVSLACHYTKAYPMIHKSPDLHTSRFTFLEFFPPMIHMSREKTRDSIPRFFQVTSQKELIWLSYDTEKARDFLSLTFLSVYGAA